MTGSKLAAAVACAALALGAAACGSDDGGGSGGSGGGGGNVAGNPGGAFASTCGGCHTLKAAGASGQVGPNLDELEPDQATVRSAIEEGPGVMPSDLFQGADADAIAAYVASNAGS
ncbi:MAG TPA: cytochrome c [Solirubrobacteraceae bacterium]|nr:cytochrome c [Solirubrobacteraceae bacterium]